MQYRLARFNDFPFDILVLRRLIDMMVTLRDSRVIRHKIYAFWNFSWKLLKDFDRRIPRLCFGVTDNLLICLLYTSPSPRDRTRSRMPSSA